MSGDFPMLAPMLMAHNHAAPTPVDGSDPLLAFATVTTTFLGIVAGMTFGSLLANVLYDKFQELYGSKEKDGWER